MPSWIEFRIGCQGLYRLALFNRGFLGYFDRSTAGALRSFGLALPILPLFLWLVWLNLDQPVPSVPFYLTVKAVAYAYGWILFPFIILSAGRLLDRDREAVGCITIYNWTSVLWMILQLPVTALDVLGLSPDVTSLLNLVLFIATLVIEGFLFVVVLRLTAWQAAALVAIDVVLSQGLIWPISDWVAGSPPGAS